mmetsp:Transcript_39420/g.122916  ORF Transcript_39420/g.122916 Transcript_39420/m.122916 type:complete len:320 (+) Transcript_39420:50-1009(+)
MHACIHCRRRARRAWRGAGLVRRPVDRPPLPCLAVSALVRRLAVHPLHLAGLQHLLHLLAEVLVGDDLVSRLALAREGRLVLGGTVTLEEREVLGLQRLQLTRLQPHLPTASLCVHLLTYAHLAVQVCSALQAFQTDVRPGPHYGRLQLEEVRLEGLHSVVLEADVPAPGVELEVLAHTYSAVEAAAPGARQAPDGHLGARPQLLAGGGLLAATAACPYQASGRCRLRACSAWPVRHGGCGGIRGRRRDHGLLDRCTASRLEVGQLEELHSSSIHVHLPSSPAFVVDLEGAQLTVELRAGRQTLDTDPQPGCEVHHLVL